MASEPQDFYLRYYVGHKGRFGHEYLEFECNADGLLRYANNSKYKNEGLIRKEVTINTLVIEEIKQMIEESRICEQSDEEWPTPDVVGRQELEIILKGQHIFFETSKIGSLLEVQKCKDAEGLRAFYYLIQDLRTLVFSLISVHFKIKPIQV